MQAGQLVQEATSLQSAQVVRFRSPWLLRVCVMYTLCTMSVFCTLGDLHSYTERGSLCSFVCFQRCFFNVIFDAGIKSICLLSLLFLLWLVLFILIVMMIIMIMLINVIVIIILLSIFSLLYTIIINILAIIAITTTLTRIMTMGVEPLSL